MEYADELYACHCEKRSDEAIQLDCDECVSLGGRGRLRRPRNDKHRSVHQQRSEESMRAYTLSVHCRGFFTALRMTNRF